jgi:cytochrome b subunit of formate dehydrogenase
MQEMSARFLENEIHCHDLLAFSAILHIASGVQLLWRSFSSVDKVTLHLLLDDFGTV